MAAAEYLINDDMTVLKTVLDSLVTNGIVGAVDKDDTGSYPVFKLYADAEKTTEVFRITQDVGARGSGHKYTYTVYLEGGGTYPVANPSNNSSANPRSRVYKIARGYTCANGVFLTATCADNPNGTYYPAYTIILTKNNADKFTAVMTNQIADILGTEDILTNMNTEHSVAVTDVSPSSVGRGAPGTNRQTQIVPFMTSAPFGESSFTPNAGRVIFGNTSTYVKSTALIEVMLNGEAWLTNGYWALKEG